MAGAYCRLPVRRRRCRRLRGCAGRTHQAPVFAVLFQSRFLRAGTRFRLSEHRRTLFHSEVICDAPPLPSFLPAHFSCPRFGCGNVFVGGAIRTGSTSRRSTIRGPVSTVEIGSLLNGTGGTVQVTFVTFLANGTFFTIGFCADQLSLFLSTSGPGQFQSWTTLRDHHRG
jgi:hypothetical protein